MVKHAWKKDSPMGRVVLQTLRGLSFWDEQVVQENAYLYVRAWQFWGHFWFRIEVKAVQAQYVTVMKSCAAFMNDSPLSALWLSQAH